MEKVENRLVMCSWQAVLGLDISATKGYFMLALKSQVFREAKAETLYSGGR